MTASLLYPFYLFSPLPQFLDHVRLFFLIVRVFCVESVCMSRCSEGEFHQEEKMREILPYWALWNLAVMIHLCHFVFNTCFKGSRTSQLYSWCGLLGKTWCTGIAREKDMLGRILRNPGAGFQHSSLPLGLPE